MRHLLAAAALLAASSAWAQFPNVTFSGYGTLGVAHSDNDQADYLIDVFKPTGPGHTRDWSFDVDSRLAGQATAAFTPRFTGVVQVLVQQRFDDRYVPVVEWANLKYEAAPDFHVRVGRVVLPVFLVNDSRRIGYANVWVRPPVEVYSMVPVTSSDGADASYRLRFGDVVNTAQVTIGQTRARFPATQNVGTGQAQGRRLMTLVDTLEFGNLTARLSYGRADLTVNTVNDFMDLFRAFGPQGVAIADRYNLQGRQVDFVGVGGSYDPGRWFVSGEWARFETSSLLASRSGWYLSGGARFGKLTGYLTYARTRGESGVFEPGLDLATLPPPVRPTAAALNAALNEQLRTSPEQRTVSIGVRWELTRNSALKFQYDDVRPGASSNGTFGNLQPGYELGSRARIFSAVLDFVF